MSARNAKVGPEVLETLSELKDGSNSRSRDNFRNFEREKSETQRALSCIQNLKYYFSEYCLTSGVHGVRYLGEQGRFLVEKLIWSAVIVTMCYFCVTLILSAYNKWITSPVIVTFAATETPVWKIPFPAVTICPVVKSDPQIFNYTDVLKKIMVNRTVTEKEFRYYESFWLACDALDMDSDVYRMLSKKWPRINESSINDLYTAFAKTDYHASWLGSPYDDILILGTYTREGICYSFNMLDIDEIFFDTVDYAENRLIKGKKSEKWSSESGYSDGDVTDAFPRRTFLPGINGGFQVQIMTNDSHLDYVCTDYVEGFKVALHHPSEFPDMNQHFRVPLDQSVSVAIKPRMITVSEEVQSYKPNERGCFFANERRLMFFRSYSQRNCLDECLSNYTLMKCGCVAFYMPKFHKTSICGRRDRTCLTKKEYILKPTMRNHTRERNLEDCNCLPSCISLAYDVEISQCEWNWRKVFHVLNGTGSQMSKSLNLEKDHYSRLSVYFSEMQFLSSERHEHYGNVEFFSNAGGLLGLFIGFSVTSAIEIVYFLTLRVVCNIRKYGRALWGDV